MTSWARDNFIRVNRKLHSEKIKQQYKNLKKKWCITANVERYRNEFTIFWEIIIYKEEISLEYFAKN